MRRPRNEPVLGHIGVVMPGPPKIDFRLFYPALSREPVKEGWERPATSPMTGASAGFRNCPTAISAKKPSNPPSAKMI